MQNFDGFNLHPALLRGVTDLGFSTPTPIQSSGIPPALEGRDVLGAAATGSGKTAAFALPILQRLLATPRRGVTRALVLAPTRELAEQITEQFNKLARHTPIKAAAIYGGVGMHPQERSLRRGVEVIVACPGRLLDHMSRGGYARLGGLEVLVLDEADRMLDMGFLPDIRRILAIVPKASQTLLFSATMPRPIAELAQTLQKNAVKLDIERPAAPAALVEQAIFPVRQDLKTALLLELLRGETIGNALVFTRTKHRADRVAQFLERNGVSVDRVHGDRTQFQRQQAVDGFRTGRTRVLVATDVAARGIDIKALSHVVNFDVPGQPDDYIHRVGRTGRAGVSGQAFTFVAPEETGDLRAIERVVARVLPRRTVEGFDYGPQPTHAPSHSARPQVARTYGRPEHGSGRPGREPGSTTSRPAARPAGRPVREDAWKRFAKPGRPSAGQTRSRRDSR